MKKKYHHKCIKCDSIFTNDIVYKSRRERICPQCNEKEVSDELQVFTRILDIACIENLASLTSNERHTVYDAFKTYISQSKEKEVSDDMGFAHVMPDITPI